MTERTVVLDPNDLTFIGLNIFTHDLLHDFNVVNFSARLSKISKDIDKLRIPQKYKRGGDSSDEDPFDETLINSDLFIENNQIKLMTEMQILQNNGMITRSRAVLIQRIQNYIYETKLYVMGMMYEEKKQLENSGGAFGTVFKLPSIKQLHDIPTHKSTSPLDIISTKNSNIKKSIAPNTNVEQDIFIQTGFLNTIRQCKEAEFKTLENYFEFMFDSYLTIVNENTENYFETFNHADLEYMLFKYFFNPTQKQTGGQGLKITLSHEQKNDVQMISVIVARGGLEYIYNKNKNNSNTNQVLETELDILNRVNSKEKVQGTIDRDIRQAFSEYANNYDSNRNFTNFEQIKKIINTKKKSMNIKVINNAVNKKSLVELDINHKVICPTSSVVDAMGTIGSCYGDIQNKEYHNMKFKITDQKGTNYYRGETVLNDPINPTSVTVMFRAKFYNFDLPQVKIVIDITTSTVITLSANTTFKKVIDTILGIWKNLPKTKVVKHGKWESLETPELFTELISNGAIKSVGDLFQEINSVVEMGGYSKDIPGFNEQLRIGAMGDQPSGVRAGYLLLTAKSGIHPNSIAGYISHPFSENNIVIISPTQKRPLTNLSNQPTKKRQKIGGKRNPRKYNTRKRRK